MSGLRRTFSERTGRSKPSETLIEGIPAHLRYQVQEWVEGALRVGGEEASQVIAARLQVPLPRSNSTASRQLLTAAMDDPDLCLDVIDLLLAMKYCDGSTLEGFLSLGGSAYAVVDWSLEMRVSDEERASFAAATAPADAVSEELELAWSHAFGMKPDPSDAWDHSIKALEALLAPVIIPTNLKATLGAILAAIEAKPSKWTLGLDPSGNQIDMEMVASLLHLIWPNPDRHQGNSPRTPRQDEAERVVQTAVLVVNLCRRGYIKVV